MEKVFSMSMFATKEKLLEAKATYYEEKCEKMKEKLQFIVDTSIVENIARPDGEGIMTCLTVLDTQLIELIEM